MDTLEMTDSEEFRNASSNIEKAIAAVRNKPKRTFDYTNEPDIEPEAVDCDTFVPIEAGRKEITSVPDLIDWEIEDYRKIDWISTLPEDTQYMCARVLVDTYRVNPVTVVLRLIESVLRDTRISIVARYMMTDSMGEEYMIKIRDQAKDLPPLMLSSYLLRMYTHAPDSFKNDVIDFLKMDHADTYKYSLAIDCTNKTGDSSILKEFIRICPESRLVNLASVRLFTKYVDSEGMELLRCTMLDESRNQRERSDAADTLNIHGLFVDEVQQYFESVSDDNFYKNSENVHQGSLMKNALGIIERLLKYCKAHEYTLTSFEVNEKYTKDYTEDMLARTNRALYRIQYDENKIVKGLTIKGILDWVYTFAIHHENKDDLLKRIYEELIEMADTCNSGYTARIVSCLLGYGDFGNLLGTKEELICKFQHVLGTCIRLASENDDTVLDEFTVEYIRDKPKLIEVIRTNYPRIVDQLYTEYVLWGHIDEEEFTGAIQKVITRYNII